MNFSFFFYPDRPAPEWHEAALLDAAAGLASAATGWRQGTTMTLDEPRRFLRALQTHLAALNAHARRRE